MNFHVKGNGNKSGARSQNSESRIEAVYVTAILAGIEITALLIWEVSSYISFLILAPEF